MFQAIALVVAIVAVSVSMVLVGSALISHRKPATLVPPSVTMEASRRNVATPPAIAPPEAIKPITPEDAEALNAARPRDTAYDPPAVPFIMPRQDVARWDAAVNCLTAAIYYEAASEPVTGQRAVAQVVLNRVRHPAFPNSVCGVVYDGWQQPLHCQFTFACDGSLNRKRSSGGWHLARTIAEAALAGYVAPEVGHATHYHASWVIPYWADQLSKVGTLGRHIFYRWPGRWGTQAAFRRSYSGVEIDPLDELHLPVTLLDVPPEALTEVKPMLSSSRPKDTPLAVDRAPKNALLADQQGSTLITKTPAMIDRKPTRLAADQGGIK